MEVKKVSFLWAEGFLLHFSEEESQEAFAFIVEKMEEEQKGFYARLVDQRDLKYVWPTLLKGGEVNVIGGEVAKAYARRWRATTSLFQGVSRKRRGKIHLYFRIARLGLNSMGELARGDYLPLSGLYAWMALGQEKRLREVLGRRASRKLRAMGFEGKGLLVRELPGGAALVLDREKEWTLSLGLPGVGVLPLEGWSFDKGAQKWATTPSDPPKLEHLLRWLKEEYPLPRGTTLRKIATEGWGKVAEGMWRRLLQEV